MCVISFASCIAFILIAKSFAIDEPICSKYDYEEKLLAKVIRMEIEMEQMKLDMETNIETRIDQAIENLTLSEIQPTPKVAFSSYNPARTEYGNDEVIVFESVLFNQGSGYDTISGIFTAPVGGLYHFIVHVCNEIQYAAVVAIVHNGEKNAVSTQFEDGGSGCGSVNAIINVEVGEQVYVTSDWGDTKMYENIHRRASFIGYLLQA